MLTIKFNFRSERNKIKKISCVFFAFKLVWGAETQYRSEYVYADNVEVLFIRISFERRAKRLQREIDGKKFPNIGIFNKFFCAAFSGERDTQ